MTNLTQDELQMQAQIMGLLQTGDADNIGIARQMMRGFRRIGNAIKAYFQPLAELAGVDFWRLFGLASLCLWGKKIKTLPESIGALTNLRWLYLQNNDLQTLPESIGALANLQGLYLQNNDLQTLPESIGALANLGGLYLQNNDLQTLPESIDKIKDLCIYR